MAGGKCPRLWEETEVLEHRAKARQTFVIKGKEAGARTMGWVERKRGTKGHEKKGEETIGAWGLEGERTP